ncbi:MAG: hypothetical protein ACYCZX_17060 [Rhodospirillaceae bacterium]
MLVIAAFMRATALVIAGYFVWYASSKAEDRLKTVGKYIAVWTFAFAAVLVVMGIAGAVMRPLAGSMGGMERMGMHARMMGMGPMGMHRGFEGERGPRFLFRERIQQDRKAEEPAPAAPAPATPAKP